MISKSFIIITLILLASSLTPFVNAAIVPARQFIFFGLVVREAWALLTFDLGFARQGYVWAAEPTATATNKKRLGGFRKLLFLGLVVRDGLC